MPRFINEVQAKPLCPLFKEIQMKQDIHPTYHEVNVTCSCGNKFTTQSSMEKENFNIEVCSECHPFYTGKQKIVDTAGRVDKFNQKFGNMFKRSV